MDALVLRIRFWPFNFQQFPIQGSIFFRIFRLTTNIFRIIRLQVRRVVSTRQPTLEWRQFINVRRDNFNYHERPMERRGQFGRNFIAPTREYVKWLLHQVTNSETLVTEVAVIIFDRGRKALSWFWVIFSLRSFSLDIRVVHLLLFGSVNSFPPSTSRRKDFKGVGSLPMLRNAGVTRLVLWSAVL